MGPQIPCGEEADKKARKAFEDELQLEDEGVPWQR